MKYQAKLMVEIEVKFEAKDLDEATHIINNASVPPPSVNTRIEGKLEPVPLDMIDWNIVVAGVPSKYGSNGI